MLLFGTRRNDDLRSLNTLVIDDQALTIRELRMAVQE
jgi:hypothetical protein